MENEIISSDKEESKNNESFMNPHQDDTQYLNLFCNDCFQIPEYKIEIDKNSISLIHECNNVEKKNLFQKKINYLVFSESQCSNCQEKCNSICIECKKYICKKCGNEHIPKKSETFIKCLSIPFEINNSLEKIYFCPCNNIQFICKSHFLQYKFFCPCCRINLCVNCKNYHQHINCPEIIGFKVNNNNQSINPEGSDDIIKNLKTLSDIFDECYSNSLKNGKMTLNIILNYSLINDIKTFIGNYLKLNMKLKKKKLIANTIFNNIDDSGYLCENFGDKKFLKNYSILIDNVDNGDYECHYKLEVLKEFYKNINRFDEYNILNKSSFYISLKGTIEYFRSQYHSVNEGITIINSNINNNYLKKEIDNINLALNICNENINLLKKINMSLWYKYNYQLRRKIGNLIMQMIIYNYWYLLDPIEEKDYILFESNILIKKKISQVSDLIGPENIKKEYEKVLMDHYSKLLEKTNIKLLKEYENLKLEHPDKTIIKEEDTELQFHNFDIDSNHIKEAVIINIFCKLRKYFGFIFNQTIHNKTEQINSQVKEEIEKLTNFNIIDNKNEIQEKKNKENEIINIRDNKCASYFKGINQIKNNFNIEDNIITNKYSSILKIFDIQQKRTYIESNIKEFKNELENLFKNYEFEDVQEIQKSLNLYFNGEIQGVLMEKREFKNVTSIKNQNGNEDLENENSFILKGLHKVEPLIDELLTYLEKLLTRVHTLIKQFERFVENIKIDKKQNPLVFLEELKSVVLMDIKDQKLIQNLYMNYLINFFFYAQDACKYLKELKNNYKEIEIIKTFERNLEKKKILDIFSSRVNFEEHSDLNQEWNKLKNEEIIVQNNPFLNEKIKEYIKNNDENQFLNDLKDIDKIKSKKINLSMADPQQLLIKAYFLQKGIPLEIPKELKFKQVNK